MDIIHAVQYSLSHSQKNRIAVLHLPEVSYDDPLFFLLLIALRRTEGRRINSL